MGQPHRGASRRDSRGLRGRRGISRCLLPAKFGLSISSVELEQAVAQGQGASRTGLRVPSASHCGHSDISLSFQAPSPAQVPAACMPRTQAQPASASHRTGRGVPPGALGSTTGWAQCWGDGHQLGWWEEWLRLLVSLLLTSLLCDPLQPACMHAQGKRVGTGKNHLPAGCGCFVFLHWPPAPTAAQAEPSSSDACWTEEHEGPGWWVISHWHWLSLVLGLQPLSAWFCLLP